MRSTLSWMAVLLVVGHASAADYGVTTRPGLIYAEHDGTKLIGDLYLPKGRAKAPSPRSDVSRRGRSERTAEGWCPSPRGCAEWH
jgi:hypothetical protein